MSKAENNQSRLLYRFLARGASRLLPQNEETGQRRSFGMTKAEFMLPACFDGCGRCEKGQTREVKTPFKSILVELIVLHFAGRRAKPEHKSSQRMQ
jgi:hypothetical protein